MDVAEARSLYAELGLTPVINARGHSTILGGSCLSPRVREAMEQANLHFVDMAALLERSGQIVADLLGADAAYITTGTAGALALGTAACIARDDVEKMRQIPTVTGPLRKVIIQRAHRYKYDRCPTLAGAELEEVGDSQGTTPHQLDAAIDEATAAILFPAHLANGTRTVSLAEVIAIGRRRGVPVIVDAAYQVFPIAHMKSYARSGADLVCISAKYLNGPNSAGILCGRRDLVTSASVQGFIGFEAFGNRSLGRPLKLDRQEIVAVVVALREWMTMDHEARLRRDRQKLRAVTAVADGLPGVALAVRPFEGLGTPRLHMRIDATSSRTAATVADALRSGSPSIWVEIDGDELIVSPSMVHDGDEHIIADRLKSLLAV